MENKSATANVDVEFVPDRIMYPTNRIRWYKPNMTAILQQYWVDQNQNGEWRNVEIVMEK